MRKASLGFTLVELAVTLAVAAIVLTVAVPSMTNMVKGNRLTAAANEMVAALKFAKDQAASRNAPIALVSNSGGADWAQGWTIQVVALPPVILRRFPPAGGDVTMMSGNGNNTFVFRALRVMPGGVDQIDICDGRTGETGRRVTISLSGGVSVTPIPGICA